MTEPTLSPTAKALLRDLLEITRQEGYDYITIGIKSHNGERDPEILAAIRELAATWLDIASRPATQEEASGLGIPLGSGSVIVTSAPVLIIESELVWTDAPNEPDAVRVSFGRIPFGQLASLAALEAEAGQ